MKPPMKIMPSFLAGVLAVILSTGTVADATVATTCKEAAASDVRVNLQMCLSQLGTTDADTWGLAKAATNECINNAALAGGDLEALAAGNPSVPMKQAIAKCLTTYSLATMSFAEALDQINQRAYAAGRKKLDEALAQTQECNAAFGTHGVTLPQPLAQHTVDTIQMAIIAGAITSLIK